MKILKIAAGLILLLGLLVVAGGRFLPQQSHVERSVVIAAPADEIFPMFNDFHEFNRWSPWVDIDPDGTEYEFSGPPAGIGAVMKWSSKDRRVGTGSQKIVVCEPHRIVKTELVFDGFDNPRYATFTLEELDQGTRLTWEFDADLDSLTERYLGLLMEKWVGDDYSRGLSRLKRLVER